MPENMMMRRRMRADISSGTSSSEVLADGCSSHTASTCSGCLEAVSCWTTAFFGCVHQKRGPQVVRLRVARMRGACMQDSVHPAA